MKIIQYYSKLFTGVVSRDGLVSRRSPYSPPVDVFMALNQDGDDVMSMEEFQRLFELLELDLKEEQKEQLFAYDGTRLGRGASHARTAP